MGAEVRYYASEWSASPERVVRYQTSLEEPQLPGKRALQSANYEYTSSTEFRDCVVGIPPKESVACLLEIARRIGERRRSYTIRSLYFFCSTISSVRFWGARGSLLSKPRLLPTYPLLRQWNSPCNLMGPHWA